MNIHWLLRLTHWIRHPPSPRRMALIAGVIAVALVIAAVENVFGWPEALTVEPFRRTPILR